MSRWLDGDGPLPAAASLPHIQEQVHLHDDLATCLRQWRQRRGAHSTAPNRRYPDLVTQRLVKACLASEAPPYSYDALAELARHCTLQEDNANKVERTVLKAACAALLESRIGDVFDAIVTGAAAKGTYVRIAQPLLEGRLVRGAEGADVGDALRVRLVGVDAAQGHIDFERA